MGLRACWDGGEGGVLGAGGEAGAQEQAKLENIET